MTKTIQKKSAGKKTKTKVAPKAKPDIQEKKVIASPGSKFGILGKDLSSKFSSRRDNIFRPTKPGGRNGQGKPS